MRVVIVILVAWTALVLIGGLLVRRLYRAERSRRRVRAGEIPASAPTTPNREPASWLRRWLSLAGFRSPSAPATFVGLTVGLFAFGAALAWMLIASGAIDQTAAVVGLVPGNALDVFLPVIYGMPWIVVVAFAALPALGVRNARRQRVRQVERDLPITLELLSTLAESGLSFDAAVDRVIASGNPERPLAAELRQFRAETMSGRPRVNAFRRLARRVGVVAFSSFVSAVVQAEQIGTGLAAVLRRQADDVRDRRRERAIEAAQALPVKRLVPLAICFLPGIFVWALGPAFSEFFQQVSAFSPHGGGR